MRVLVQRVKEASVTVGETVPGSIGPGLLLYLGIHQDDTPDKTDWLVKKVADMRIFRDDEGKMNRSLRDVEGEVLVISQFTLYGNCENGRRPEFTDAALPEPAFLLYEQFISELTEEIGRPVATGVFGALMEVASINDGPVTFLLEK